MTSDAQAHAGASAQQDEGAGTALQELLPALAWLDQILARASDQVPNVFGQHVVGDRYRGLYVSAADVEQALRRPPDAPALGIEDDGGLEQLRREALAPGSRLQRIVDAHELSDFDIDVVLLALAPELDRRYERLYAYLQDDIAARRPTVDLALQLFGGNAAQRLFRRQRFAHQQPLLRFRVVSLDAGSVLLPLPLLANVIRLDEQITDALLGHEGLDRRLAGYCRYDDRMAPIEGAEIPGATLRQLRRYVELQQRESMLPVLQFTGQEGCGRQAAAGGLAAALNRRLLVLDLGAVVASPDAALLASLAVREAWLRDAVLYCARAESLRSPSGAAVRECLLSSTQRGPPAIVLALPDSTVDLAPDAPRVSLARPSYERRRTLWGCWAAERSLRVDEAGLGTLAARFELTPRQIERAVGEASAQRYIDDLEGSGDSSTDDLQLLFAAARRRSGEELAALATRIEPVHRFSDLVVPVDAAAQLRELCDRVERRATVMDSWGFGARLSSGKGVNALFSGAPGTGKTMAAEVVAHTLGVDLFRVELAGVVSKYIGETEQNLDRIFNAAEHANAVILFDEADALFGKRSEVHDAHDRYANIEISYLLQRMEEYGGVAILSTNLRGNLDAAFLRRLSFTIHFPLPDVESRRRIWHQVWPDGVPRAADLALDLLAAHFVISGGHIRNIAVASAYLAAGDGGVVTMRHMLAATSREYQKLGKALTDSDLAPFRRWTQERA